ncbi:hypothetical protein HMPREF0539_2590 [Lacticaseibacillus rhamnosus LMS2-1]|uniref:Uncharacterized protein n=1 Tax=Lacticaseibacillus rhamnosus (strain LMS2-1) TaxID=525361 RepID=C2K0A5_LACRM|nr:hypothetical protein HMPREF0539_2590 [Lacticaseibacillus rhamnosus LMS2-1]
MSNIPLKSDIDHFGSVAFCINIQHFDPSVLSRQTKPHCGFYQV